MDATAWDPIVWDWISLVVRWIHLITGIAWIGASFYFIHLDASLRRPGGLPAGVAGEAWQVHGGGFYRMQKYLVAPARAAQGAHLVQVRGLLDLDQRLRAARSHLLPQRRPLS